MSRIPLEVADVFRSAQQRFLHRFGQSSSREQRRVLRDVARCRTAELGGHADRCLDCGHQRIAYNSCRNRHCPKCHAAARRDWTDARSNELLPVPYFHIVFTIPHQLSAVALQNKRALYRLLMQSASETLQEVSADPKHLGGKIGGLMVLHTWGQNLMHHPHVHCVVPAGAIAPDRREWIPSRRNFFLPVRVLSRVFRGKFIAGLKRLYQQGNLMLAGQLKTLIHPDAFEQFLNRTVRRDWVVYAKRPFGGPQQVLKYLARYTHRVAIANSRLVTYRDGKVTFRWKDYADESTCKLMTLDDVEFVRRFLLHTLPKGFHRIRHFGFLANRHRTENLKLCNRLLTQNDDGPAVTAKSEAVAEIEKPVAKCEGCGSERVLRLEIIPIKETMAIRRPHFMMANRTVRRDTS